MIAISKNSNKQNKNKKKSTRPKPRVIVREVEKTKPIATVETKPKEKGSLGRTLLNNAGGFVGDMFGAKEWGQKAGDFFSDILGMGDYKVKTNSLALNSNQPPQFGAKKDGSVIMAMTEYVTDLVGSNAFTATTYDIHPNNCTLFPRLSQIAATFEQFEFLGLVFTYVPTSGDAVASTNPALGTVIMATEYDTTKSVFFSKQQMEDYEFATQCVPRQGMFHPVECNPNCDIVNARYSPGPLRGVPYNQLPTVSDPAHNLQSLGRLQIATQGMQTSNVVGEVHVSYHIKLSKPRVNVVGSTDPFLNISTGNNSTYSRTNGQTYLGGQFFTASNSTANGIGIFVNNSSNTMIFAGIPDGSGIEVLVLATTVSGVNHVGYPTLVPTGLTAKNNYFLDSGGGTAQFGAGSATTNTSVYVASFTTNSGTSNTSNPGTMTFGNVGVTGGDSVNLCIQVRVFPNITNSTGTPYIGPTVTNEMIFAKQLYIEQTLKEKQLQESKTDDPDSPVVLNTPLTRQDTRFLKQALDKLGAFSTT